MPRPGTKYCPQKHQVFKKMCLYPSSNVHLSIQALSTVHRGDARSPLACLGITRPGHHFFSAPGLLLRHPARTSLAVLQEGGPHLFVQLTQPRHSHPAIFRLGHPPTSSFSKNYSKKPGCASQVFGRGFVSKP